MEEAIEWLPPPSQPTHWLRLRVDLGLERHSGLDSPRWSRSRSRCQPASQPALPLLSFVAGSVYARNYALDTPPSPPSLSFPPLSLLPLRVRDDCLLQRGWFPESLIKESVRERPLREPPQNVGDDVFFFFFIIHSLIPRSEAPCFPHYLPLFPLAYFSRSHLTFPASARPAVSSVCFCTGSTMSSPLSRGGADRVLCLGCGDACGK